MFYVGLSRAVDRTVVESVLAAHAPGRRAHWGEWSDAAEAEFFIQVHDSPSEFPWVLDVCNLSGLDSYQLGLELAADLSRLLACTSVCDGSLHGPDGSPYWCILWDHGRPFLGDDCNSLFFDGPCVESAEELAQLGPIQRVAPLPFPLPPPSRPSRG